MDKYYENKKAYAQKNKKLLNAKQVLKYNIKKYLNYTVVYGKNLTSEQINKHFEALCKYTFKQDMRSLTSVEDILAKIKEYKQKTIEAKEKLEHKGVLKPNKHGKPAKIPAKRKWYLKNRNHCIAYSKAYVAARKEVENSKMYKADTPEFKEAISRRCAELLPEFMSTDHKAYNKCKKKHVLPKRGKRVKSTPLATATTATADTIITIAGDVNIEPHINVSLDDAACAPMIKHNQDVHVFVEPTFKPVEVFVTLKDPMFALFIGSIGMTIGMLITMFLK